MWTLVEWLSYKVLQNRHRELYSKNRLTPSQNQGMFGQPGAIRTRVLLCKRKRNSLCTTKTKHPNEH